MSDKPLPNYATGINWEIEKDIRLFALSKLSSKSSDIFELYRFLEDVMDSDRSTKVEVNVSKLVKTPASPASDAQ